METGVTYNKRRLHKVGYFRELLADNDAIGEKSIRPVLELSRDSMTQPRTLSRS
jgi:hypothetical protein